MNWIKSFGIKLSLILGFGTLIVIIMMVVLISVFQMNEALRLTENIAQLRVPTANTSARMLNGLNEALAALRGWMLLGDEQFKEKRAEVWRSQIYGSLETMEKLSPHWTNPANVARFKQIKTNLDRFERFQQEIEDIAQNPENIPANQMLLDQAAPQAAIMSENITRMINLEIDEAPSHDRKVLLKTMADMRGSLGLALASIRAFLLFNEELFQKDYQNQWEKHQKSFQNLKDKVHLLTIKQRSSLTVYTKAHDTFAPLPLIMIESRDKEDWNLANYWLAAKAAPVGAQLVTLLNDMQSNQELLLDVDSNEIHSVINQIIITEWVLLGIGLLIAIFFGYFLINTILRQVGGEPAEIMKVAQKISKGNFEVGSQDKGTGIYASLQEIAEQTEERIRLLDKSEELKESEARNRGSVETAVDGIVMINNMGIVEAFNPAAEKLFGYTPEEVIGQNVKMLMPNPYSSEHDGYLNNYKRSGVRKIIGIGRELVALHKDGRAIPIFLSIGEIKLADQSLFTGILRDITKEKEAQQELLETEAKTRTIVENELAEKQKEVEEQNWLKSGQNGLNEIMRGEQDMRVLSQNIINYIADYLDAQVGAFYLAYSDTLKLTSSYAYKIRNNNYTEFKLGEGLPGQAALEKKSILFADLPESHLNVDINSGLGTSQPANILAVPLLTGGELMGVLELGTSRQFEKREMAFLDQITENVAIAINSSQNRSQTQELLEETQRQAEELESQQEALRQVNEDLSQKSESLEAQKADIEKKNSEIEKKSEELALSSKYKSEFLANMSHELRSPLNSLLLLSRSLSENKEENLSEKQLESIRIIYDGGNDLLSLINEILDLSRIEAGRADIEFNEVTLQDLADSVKNNFQHLASNKGLELVIEVDPQAPTLFLTDRKRLEQVMKNLISNSLKFTEKGQISVEFKPCPKDISLRSDLESTNLLMIAITDTGIGIAQEKQQLIFEAFQQADGGTSRQYGGTGLGLSISRELIHLLGGEIQLESEVGKGSKFMLFLPIEPDAQTLAAKTIKRATTPLPQARLAPQVENQIQFTDDRDLLEDGDHAVLVIDDDINFANIIRDQCLEKGLKCLIAPTGEDGLQLVNQFMPVGIIMDLHLPGIDGWTVLEKLKEDTPTRHIPVHIISVEESTLEATKKGAIGFLTKPVTPEELEEVLEKIEEVIQKKVKKLLVIEDEEPQRKRIVELVGDHDVIVTEAANGEEGIQAIQSEDFDCIILDLVLPDITGFQLLRQLDQDEKVSLPPVVIYTGKDLSREEEMDLRQYTNSIIIKTPRSEERLLDQTALFLHRVVNQLPAKKQETIRKLHDKELIFKNKKILVVDDDMRNLFSISKILEENGMKTLEAEQGQKGLDLLKKEPDVDLILMDIMMPGMDGYETIRRIRKQRKFAKLPIIALTAKAMPGDREKCIEAGANDYLSKPVNIDRLFSMMRIWLYQ